MKKITVCLFLSLTLSGCSSYNNKFDCPHGQGLGCASVSKVNKMLDANLVDTGDKLPISGHVTSQQIPIYFGPERPSQVMNTLPLV